MRGDTVVVRCLGEEQAVVRVWEDFGEVVAVLSDEDYRKRQRGERANHPVGFRRRDVFRWSDVTSPGLVLWCDMEPYTGA